MVCAAARFLIASEDEVIELLFEAMSTSRVGQPTLKGEPAFSIAALRRFHKLFWEVGKLAVDSNLRFREELLQLSKRVDDARGFNADLVTLAEFHRICRCVAVLPGCALLPVATFAAGALRVCTRHCAPQVFP